jgi:hypothetical protein
MSTYLARIKNKETKFNDQNAKHIKFQGLKRKSDHKQ